MLKYNNEQKEYEYISDNNITYSLYEGVSMPQLIDLDEQKSSDIIFIILDAYAELDINTHFVNFVYGADFLGRDKDLEESIKYYVDRFEEENSELIKQIQDELGNISQA